MSVRREFEGGKYYIAAIPMAEKAGYGIIYGIVPWADQYMEALYNFLNDEVWGQGYIIRFFDIAHLEVGGTHCVMILGIIQRKTLWDRIRY